MIEFARPWLLLLWLGVPFLVWRWLERPRAAIRFPDAVPFAGLPSGRAGWVKWGGATLRAAGLLLIITALAGPRWPDPRSRIPTQGIAIQLVLDVSGSMAEADYDWDGTRVTRLDAAKNVLRLFVAGGTASSGERLEGRPNDLMGLVTFATWPETFCPLTLSHAVLLRALDDDKNPFLKPRTLPNEAHTNIGDALAWGLHRLEATNTVRKVLMLISDGEHNATAPALTARQAAQLAANLGVRVYTIDVGGEGSSTERTAENRSEGEKTLKAVAQATGARYFQARDTEGLVTACSEIDRLERNRIDSFVYQRFFELYPWIGLAALTALVLVFALDSTFWRRAP